MSNTPVIERVTRERWLVAQEWERHHWVRTQYLRARYFKNTIWRLLAVAGLVPKHRGDDWNVWWRAQFADYDFLPAEVENAIEVGCGPYTNVRLMLDRCRIRHLVLSDPLIRTYVHFKLTFVAEMYRKAACILDDHPLEALPGLDTEMGVLRTPDGARLRTIVTRPPGQTGRRNWPESDFSRAGSLPHTWCSTARPT